jgi:hypothetical protein
LIFTSVGRLVPVIQRTCRTGIDILVFHWWLTLSYS